MAKPRHPEFPDTGEFGQWSDRMERIARAARRRSKVEAIRSHASGIRNLIWDLSDEPGKYIDNTFVACDACDSVTNALRSAINYLDEHEGEMSSILANPNHPSRIEAIESFGKLQVAFQSMRSDLDAMSEAIERLDIAIKQGSHNKKAR